MGSDTGRDREKPMHQVYLDDYYIDKYEVTNAQYAACVSVGKCTEPHDKSSQTRPSYYGNPEFAKYPVVRVDWSQAKSYCDYMGKQLPTEAHWEKAARGTDGRTYPWGNGAASCNLANYSGCVGDTTAVGSYPSGASPYGVMDMAGNVWEWTSTDYKAYPYQADDGRENLLSNNPKTVRGGSWFSRSDFLRCAYRLDYYPYNPDYLVGLRCFFVFFLK